MYNLYQTQAFIRCQEFNRKTPPRHTFLIYYDKCLREKSKTILLCISQVILSITPTTCLQNTAGKISVEVNKIQCMIMNLNAIVVFNFLVLDHSVIPSIFQSISDQLLDYTEVFLTYHRHNGG